MQSFKLAKKDDKDAKASKHWLDFSIGDEELQQQVDNYDSLKITESYRGISLLAIAFSMAVTLALVAVHWIAFDSIYSLVIYLPLAAFIYKGHRWAIIAMMLLWTYEKGYSVVNGSAFIVALIWWAFYMGFFYKALRVENARRKNK